MILYAMDAGYIDQYLSKMENASSEDKKLALEQFGDVQSDGIIVRENGSETASLNISGPLSVSGPSPLARFFGFGGTGYNEIISAAKMLAKDPTVKNVVLTMNTPGGTIEGMDEAKQSLDALTTAGKIVTAENHGMIASAGYYMAMAASSIKAVSPLAVTGSIGVIVAGLDMTGLMEANGIRKIKIVSKNAPDKQADPTTDKGRDIIQAQIDAMERVFIDTVADGRGTTDADVIANFGKGGLLIAKDPEDGSPDALSVGMIDSVVVGGEVLESGNAGVNAENCTNEDDLCYNSAEADEKELLSQSDGDPVPQSDTASGGNLDKDIIMDINKLKAEHPSVFAEAVKIGADQERGRVEAHITMGEAAGDTNMALENIKAGADLTPAINAKYMAAGMNSNAVAARAAETPGDIETPAATDASVAAADVEDNAVAAALAKLTGVKIDG